MPLETQRPRRTGPLGRAVRAVVGDHYRAAALRRIPLAHQGLHAGLDQELFVVRGDEEEQAGLFDRRPQRVTVPAAQRAHQTDDVRQRRQQHHGGQESHQQGHADHTGVAASAGALRPGSSIARLKIGVARAKL